MQFRQLAEVTSRLLMPVVGIDREGRVIYVNDTLRELLHLEGDAHLGAYFWEFISGEHAEYRRERFLRLRDSGIERRFETPIIGPDGTQVLISWHTVPFYAEDGRLESIFGVGADITALRTAEERLALINSALQALNAISGLTLRAEDPREFLESACETLVSTEACTGAWVILVGDTGAPIGILGSQLPDGRQPWELQGTLRALHPCMADVVEGANRTVIKQAGESCPQCPFIPQEPSGHVVITGIEHAGKILGLLIAQVGPSGPGKRRMFRSVADDMGLALTMLQVRAARLRTARALDEQRSMLDAFFESATEPVAILDPEFDFVRANEVFAASCDRSASELPGLHYFDLFPDESNQTIFERVRDTGEAYSISAMPFSFPNHPEWGVTWWDWSLVPSLDESGNVSLLTLWLREVTAEQRAVQELSTQRDRLAESTRMLDAFFEGSLDPAAILDRDFNFVRVNRAYADTCALEPEDLAGRNHFEMYPNEENEAIFARVRDTGEPVEIHAKPFEFPDHPEWGVTWWDWTLVPLRGATGEVELLSFWLRDVTVEQRALQDLEAQRDRLDELVRERTEELQQTNELLHAVVAESPVAISVHDLSGNLTMWNAAAERMTGWSADEVLGKPSPLVPPEREPESRSLFAGIVAGKSLSEATIRRVHRDGHIMDLRLSAAPLRDAEGKVAGVVGLFRDETERLRAERELQRTNELLRTIVDASPIAIEILDTNHHVTLWNEAAEAITGYSAPEAVGKTPPIVPPERIGEFYEIMQRIVEGEQVLAAPLERLRADGTPMLVEWSGAPIVDMDGSYAGAVALFSDVTEREEAARERERLLNALQAETAIKTTIIENAPVGITLSDREGRALLANPAGDEIRGGPPPVGAPASPTSDYIYHTDGTPYHTEDLPSVRAARTGEIVHTNDVVFRRPDGQERHIELAAAPVRGSDGEITGAVALFSDVSEREAAAAERERLLRDLAQERATLEAVIQNAPVGIVLADAEARVLLVNPEAEAMYKRPVPVGEDRTSQAALQLCHSNGTPYDVDDLPLTRAALDGEVAYTRDLAIVWPDGQRRDLVGSAAPIRTPSGEIKGAVGIFSDVTDERTNERERERLVTLLEDYANHLEEMVGERTLELAQSHEELKTQRDFVDAVIENAGALVTVVDAKGRVVRFNETCEQVSGYTADEVVGRDFVEAVIPEEGQEQMRKDFETLLSQSLSSYENWWRRKGGGLRRISWRVTTIRDGEGQAEFVIGSGWDVTQERLMEQALRESEMKYRELVEGARTIIIHWDLDGTIRFMNEYGLEFFGYTQKELLGQPVTILVPPTDSRGEDLTGLVSAIVERPEEHWINENENVAKDGTRSWVSWSNRLMRDEDGNATGIMAIGIDHTAQREAEEQLRQSREHLRDLAAEVALVEQRERREIATVLHDNIGQLLAFSKLKLSGMLNRGEMDVAGLEQLLHYVDEAIGETRSLTSQLSPAVLEQLGFVAALQWLADEFNVRHGVPVKFIAEAHPEELSEEIQVTLFQATRELITNAIKHAKARQVTVRLKLKDTSVCVDVTDDGVGFDINRLSERQEGHGGFGLFNVRERITYLGGEVTVDSTPGVGTNITIICPAAAKETSG